MRILNNNRRIVLTAILVAVLFVSIGLPKQARAAEEGVGFIQRQIAGGLYVALTVTNAGVVALVKLLQATLYFKVDTEFPVVKDMWKIVRDFANMLFIVVLIAVAMGTVFNVKSFGFGDLDLGGGFLVQFLIAALLINFSLTIGGLIINGTQVINDTFLSSIGNFENRLGAVLNPKVLIGLPADASVLVDERVALQIYGSGPLSSLTQNMVLQLFFTFILSVVLLFSLLVPVIFTIARIPMLMILLVFAPGAWLLGILPGTRQASKQWWSQFWGWNLFLPFYLLVLYFGLYFLSYQKTILESIDRTGGAGIAGFSNTDLSTVFFYFVTAMIFVMGTAAATKASFLSGTSAGKVAGWARGKVGGWWFGGRAGVYAGRLATGALAGGVTKGIQGYEEGGVKGFISGTYSGASRGLFSSKQVTEAIGKRATEKVSEIKREGFSLPVLRELYGGTRKGEQLGAEVAGALGDKGAVSARLKADVGDFKKEYEDYTPIQLRDEIVNPKNSDARKLAAYEVLKSKKVLDASEIGSAFNLYSKYSPRSATTFALDVDYEKMSRSERKQVFDSVKNTDIRKKIIKAMAEKEDIEDAEELYKKAEIFESWDDKLALINKIKKKHLAAAMGAKVRFATELRGGLPKEDPRVKALEKSDPRVKAVEKVQDTVLEEVREEVRKLNNDKIVEMDAGKSGLGNGDVQQAFSEVFLDNSKRAAELAPRLSKKQRDSFEKVFGDARKANEGRISGEIEELIKQIQELQKKRAGSKDSAEIEEFGRQINVLQEEDIKPLRTELKSIRKNLS